MRKLGLVTFCATTCVLVPAAYHQLVAAQEQVDKLGDPDLDRFALGSTHVSVALDRYILDPGETLNVHIAAANAPSGPLELGVLVLGSNGSEGSRVPSPPVGVAFRAVKLDVTGGVAQTAIAIPLKGAAGTQYEPFGHYKVLVGPRATLAKLERLRKAARLIGDDEVGIPDLNKAGNEFFQAYWAIDNDSPMYDADGNEVRDSPYAADKIAIVDAHVRPKSDAIALALPAHTTTNEAFTAAVTVTNPGRRAMSGLEVTLAQHQGISGYVDGVPELVIEPEVETIDLAPGETRRIEFTVSGAAAGVFGLLAQANCNYEIAGTKKCRDVQALQLGTFDATEIQAPEHRRPIATAALTSTETR